MSDFDFDSILNAGIAAADAAVPVKPVDKNISPNENKAYEQLGYQLAAERESLGDDFEQYGSTLPEGLSTTQLAAISRGMSKYYDDANAMYDGDAFDNAQAIVGGVAEGAFNTGITTAAAIAGGIADLQAASINSARRMQGLPEYAHNYLGDWATASAQAAEGFGNLFRNAEEEIEQRALAANRAARERKLEQQYQEDRARGMSAGQAGFRDLLRGFSVGIENVLDSPTQALNTFGQAAGQLGFQGAIRNAAGKLIGAGAKSAFANRALEAATLGVTEGASSIGDAANAIDKLTDDQLFKQSPEFAQLYQDNLLQGKSKEQASKDARTELKRQASLTEALLGGASAMVAGAAVRPLERLGSMSPFKDYPRDVFSEALEEAITGAGQGFGSNIAAQQTYDPNKRLTEGVGAQISEGAFGGGIAAAGLRAPGTIAQGAVDLDSYLDQHRQAKQEKASTAKNTLTSIQQTRDEGIQSSTIGTIEEDSGLSEDELDKQDYEVVTKEDGTKEVRYRNPDIDDPFYISDEQIEAHGLTPDDEGTRPHALDLLQDIINKSSQIKVSKENLEDSISLAQEYIDTFDKVKENLIRNVDLTNKLADKEKTTFNSEQAIFNQIYYDALTGNKLSIDLSKLNPAMQEAAKNIFNNAKAQVKAYDTYQSLIAKRGNIKKGVPESVSAFAANLANGYMDINSPKVQQYVASLKKKKSLSDPEKKVLAIHKLLQEADKAGVGRTTIGKIKDTASNVYTGTKGTREGTRNIITALNKAIAMDNAEKYQEALTRLYKLAKTRQNKALAFQEALINQSNEEFTYESVNSKDLSDYIETAYLTNFDLYDSVQQEQANLTNVFNTIKGLLDNSDLGENFSTEAFPALSPLSRPQNEKELKVAFKKKFTKTSGTITDGSIKSSREAPKKTPKETPSVAQESDVEKQSTNVPPVEEVPVNEAESASTKSTAEQVDEAIKEVIESKEKTNEVAKETTEPKKEITKSKKKEPSFWLTYKNKNLLSNLRDFIKKKEGNNAPTELIQDINDIISKRPKQNLEQVEKILTGLKDYISDSYDEEQAKDILQAIDSYEVNTEVKPFNDLLVSINKFLNGQSSTEPKEETSEDTTESSEETPTQESSSQSTEEEPEEETTSTSSIESDDEMFQEIPEETTSSQPEEEEIPLPTQEDQPVPSTDEEYDLVEPSQEEQDEVPSPEESPKEEEPVEATQEESKEETPKIEKITEDSSAYAAKDIKIQQQVDSGLLSRKTLLGVELDKNHFVVASSAPRIRVQNLLFDSYSQAESNKLSPAKAVKQLSDLIGSLRAYLYVKDKNVKDNERLSIDEKINNLYADAEERIAKAKEQQKKASNLSKSRKELLKGTKATSTQTFNKDKATITDWINGFREFNKKTYSKLNLDSYFKNGLANGKEGSALIFGLKKVTKKDKKGNKYVEFNWDDLAKDRQLAIFMQPDATGGLTFNTEVENAMALASLHTVQQLETRANPKKDEQLIRDLENHGLDSSVLSQLPEEVKAFFRVGTDLNSVISMNKRTFMDILGIKVNQNNSTSIDGNVAATTFAEHAASYIFNNGSLALKSFSFENIEPNANKPPKWRYIDLKAISSTGKAPTGKVKTLTYAIPITVFSTKEKPITEHTFKTVGMEDAFAETFLHEVTKDVYYTRESMPKAPSKKLRSNTPNTEGEKKAMEKYMDVKYHLDVDYANVLKGIGAEGALELAGLDTDPDEEKYNSETFASLEGKRTNVVREFQTFVNRAEQATLINPDDPSYYQGGNEHKGGRWQEDTPNGSQASKMNRCGFSNVKEEAGPKNELHMEGFRRAVLQAFGEKVKRKSSKAVQEIFDKLEQAFIDTYGDRPVEELFRTVNEIQEGYKLFERVLKGEKENPWLALSAMINMARYIKAKREGTTFTDTIPLEFDGSCNGFANSWMKLAFNPSFTSADFIAMFRSQMFYGLSDMTSDVAWEEMPSDNYTGNADATEAEISEMLNALIEDLHSGSEERFPERVITNRATGENVVVNPLTLAINVLTFIGLVMGDAVKVNEAALNSGSSNRDSAGELIRIGRLAIKFPTVRINYGQGEQQNTIEFINDLSAELSKKFSDILHNPESNPAFIFFKDKLSKGEMTQQQAVSAFNNLMFTFNLLNNVTLEEDYNENWDIVRFLDFNSTNFAKFPFFQVGINTTLNSLGSKNKKAFKEFVLSNKSNYSNYFQKNIAEFFAKPMYRAIDNSRSAGYKDFSKLLTKYSSVAADFKAKYIIERIKEVQQDKYHKGLLPSQNEINALVDEANKLFPTTIRTKVVAIDMATEAHVKLQDTITTVEKDSKTGEDKEVKKTKDVFAIPARKLPKLTVENEESPFNGESILSEISTSMEVVLPQSNGIGPVATVTIATSDGNMQTLIALNENNHPSTANRYDGSDAPSTDYANTTQVVNKAVRDTLKELPSESLLSNVETFLKNLPAALDRFGSLEKDLSELLQKYDKDLERKLQKQKSFEEGLIGQESDTDSEKSKITLTREESISHIKKEFLNKAQTFDKRAYARALVLLSLPVNMQHMSAGPDGYVVRDPRDTFEVPMDTSMEFKIQKVVEEAQRRLNIVNANLDTLYRQFKKDGEFKIPDEIYQNIPSVAAPEPAKSAKEVGAVKELVTSKPKPITRELPNTRTEDRTIEPTASVDTPPKRETTTVQPQATNTGSVRTGRLNPILQEAFKNYLEEAKEIAKSRGDLEEFKLTRNFFNQFINNNLAPNVEIVSITFPERDDMGNFLGNVEYPAKYSKSVQMMLDNPDTIAFYNSEQNVVVLNENRIEEIVRENAERAARYRASRISNPDTTPITDAYVPSTRDSIIVHEVFHAIMGSRLYQLASNPDHPQYHWYLKLKQLQWDVAKALKKEDPELYEREREYIFEGTNDPDKLKTFTYASVNDEVYRLNEFIDYMITEPAFRRFCLTRGRDTPFANDLRSLSKTENSILKKVFRDFLSILKNIFHLKSWDDVDQFLSFYGQAVTISSAIVQFVQENEHNSYEPLPAISGYAASSGNNRIARLGAKVEDISTRITNTLSPLQRVAEIDAAERRRKATHMKLISWAESVGIPLSKQQYIVAAGLADLYNNAMELNSSIRLNAINLRKDILNKLEPEDLIFENDGADSLLAQIRYDFLAGLENAEGFNGKNESLGVFMGLLAVSDDLRQAVDKAYGKTSRRSLATNNAVTISDSPLDTFFSTWGEQALQEVNNLIDSVSIRKGAKASEVLDSINQNFLQIKKDASILEKPANLLNKADDYVSNKIDRVGTALITGEVLNKLVNSDSKLARIIATGLGYSVPFILKDTNPIYIKNKERILALVNKYGKENPNFYSRLMSTAFRELASADENANAVYSTQKIAKGSIQASRSNWREVVPLELKKKFKDEGVVLSKNQAASLDTVILQSDLGTLSNQDVQLLMKGNLNKMIAQRQRLVSGTTYNYAEDLAKYMSTGKATEGMLRNAEAIVKYSQIERIRNRSLHPEDASVRTENVQIVDELVTLLVLRNKAQDLKVVRDIYSKAPNSFNYALAQQRQNALAEKQKANDNPERRYNIFKGYYPQDTLTKTNVKVVHKANVGYYRSLGYEILGDASDRNFVYMKSSINPITTFDQGGLQSIINQVGGIDEVTGWSPNDKVYRRTKSKAFIKGKTKGLRDRTPRTEAWIPLLDAYGTKVVGYELTVNPEMYTSVTKEKDFANNLGAWKGRQVEEAMAYETSIGLIDTINEQYQNASPQEREEQYTDVIALARRDPVVATSLENIPPKVRKHLSGTTELPKSWYIRNDLIEDVIGRRQASVIDFATGETRWDPEVQRKISNLVKTVLGQKGFTYLYRAESILKATSSSIRNFIVIRSGEVLAMNFIGNIFSLMIRGVPLVTILKETPKIIKELENYNHSKQRQAILQMEINAEKGSENPSQRRLKILENKLANELALVDSLTYSRDLIKAGEYNTIADIGDVEDDILLSTGRVGEYLEKQVSKLPKVVKEAGRQLVVTKDTAIYRALEKGTQYGDFVAKAILYKHLKDKKGMQAKDALSRVRYEFVNYDMLPGRTREYLENLGVLWFYNYKLRIARTTMSMIKENPVSALLSMFSPIQLGIGTPITDNFFAKLVTNPLGSVGFKLFEVPWIFNHLWYNMLP